jgi:hypothetical protein
MTAMNPVVLQNFMDFEKDIPVLRSETCPTSYDVNYFIILKLKKSNIYPPSS